MHEVNRCVEHIVRVLLHLLALAVAPHKGGQFCLEVLRPERKKSRDNQMHCNYTSVYYRVTYPLERIHEWALMTLPWHEKLKSPVASLFMCSSPMCEQRWSLAKFILMLE